LIASVVDLSDIKSNWLYGIEICLLNLLSIALSFPENILKLNLS